MTDVAIIGTGRMGAAMTRRLVDAGRQVVLWNRTSSAADELADELGPAVTTTSTPQAAVAAAPVVLSVLANGDATERALTDAAVLAALSSGTVVVDMGTSGTVTAKRLEAAIAATGAAFVDAPVSGSVATVEAGVLLVLASGDDRAVDVVEPVLSAFSKRVVRLGAPGNGQAMKLAVNLVVHGLNAIVSESLALAEAAGIDRGRAYDVLQSSVVAAPYLDYKRGALLGEDDGVAFTLALVEKDLRLITRLAADLHVPVRVTDAAAQAVHDAVERGFGDRDMGHLRAAIVELAGGPRAAEATR